MSKIKNDGLDQYGAEPFEQQQFGTAGVEGINLQLVGGWWCGYPSRRPLYALHRACASVSLSVCNTSCWLHSVLIYTFIRHKGRQINMKRKEEQRTSRRIDRHTDRKTNDELYYRRDKHTPVNASWMRLQLQITFLLSLSQPDISCTVSNHTTQVNLTSYWKYSASGCRVT